MRRAASAEVVSPVGLAERDDDLWRLVGALLGRAATPADVAAHRLEALAEWCGRSNGNSAPPSPSGEGRAAEVASFMAPLLLGHVRAATGAELVLVKGPEVSARYPHPSARPFGDLDVVVGDATAVQKDLMAYGFVPVGDARGYRGIHHLRPLHLAGFPLVIEVHARPKWPEFGRAPTFDELRAVSVPCVVPVNGVRTPSPAHHAVLLAAHAWAHRPLGRLADLVDVAAILADADRDEAAAVAQVWGLTRVWRATVTALDSLLDGAPRPFPLRVWARHLDPMRERTVLENHLTRWLAPFAALPVHRAVPASVAAMARDLRPAAGESGGRKLARSLRAIANASRPISEHEASVRLGTGDVGERVRETR